MNQIFLNEKPYQVEPSLAGYSILSKPSSNVECFGVDCDNLRFFIQFKNGVSYFFHGVPLDVLNGVVECDSIGKYFNGNIARKFESDKVLKRLVEEVREHV